MAKSTVPSALLRAGGSDCATWGKRKSTARNGCATKEIVMATAEAKLHVAEFTNEPFIDFSNAEDRKKMEAALAKVKGEFGHEYPMWIAGQQVITTGKKKSTNPSRPSEVIGVFQDASKEQAAQAVEAANKYFDVWKKVPAETRGKYLFQGERIVSERKVELGARVCFE